MRNPSPSHSKVRSAAQSERFIRKADESIAREQEYRVRKEELRGESASRVARAAEETQRQLAEAERRRRAVEESKEMLRLDHFITGTGKDVQVWNRKAQAHEQILEDIAKRAQEEAEKALSAHKIRQSLAEMRDSAKRARIEIRDNKFRGNIVEVERRKNQDLQERIDRRVSQERAVAEQRFITNQCAREQQEYLHSIFEDRIANVLQNKSTIDNLRKDYFHARIEEIDKQIVHHQNLSRVIHDTTLAAKQEEWERWEENRKNYDRERDLVLLNLREVSEEIKKRQRREDEKDAEDRVKAMETTLNQRRAQLAQAKGWW